MERCDGPDGTFHQLSAVWGQDPGPRMWVREGHPGVQTSGVRGGARGRFRGHVPHRVGVHGVGGQEAGLPRPGLRRRVRRGLGMRLAPASEAGGYPGGHGSGAPGAENWGCVLPVLQGGGFPRVQGRQVVHRHDPGGSEGAGRGDGVRGPRFMGICGLPRGEMGQRDTGSATILMHGIKLSTVHTISFLEHNVFESGGGGISPSGSFLSVLRMEGK